MDAFLGPIFERTTIISYFILSSACLKKCWVCQGHLTTKDILGNYFFKENVSSTSNYIWHLKWHIWADKGQTFTALSKKGNLYLKLPRLEIIYARICVYKITFHLWDSFKNIEIRTWYKRGMPWKSEALCFLPLPERNHVTQDQSTSVSLF